MSKSAYLDKFKKLSYKKFQGLALDKSLSKFEKIGFPDHYRASHEANIFRDIKSKLTLLDTKSKSVLDIGSGCSELPLILIEHCNKKNHQLTLVDSKEMLNLIPDTKNVNKVSGMYPKNISKVRNAVQNKVDVIICYSVLQYIFVEVGFWQFIDLSLSLLGEGGQMLLGDIPNNSMRKRFLSSSNGIAFHKSYMNTLEEPELSYNLPEPDEIDDSVLLAVLARVRAAGANAYVLPQDKRLPMANRREDILICKP
jgi:cyclopropane fatty-acyl-phospholipid synthase-like methyltransferase